MSNIFPLVLTGITATSIALAAFSSGYVIEEGKVGVITKMGKADRQEGPNGLQWKLPFVTGVQEFDIRERKISGQFISVTANQLSTTIDFSVNWRPQTDAILEIFRNYGSPEAFATNVVQPRLQQAMKTVIGQFSSTQMIQNRQEVADAMLAQAVKILEGYPAEFLSVQIDNFTLPNRYWESVIAKEEQRERTEKEQLVLAQQNIQAQAEVQTANAQRDAAIIRADGEAYATVKAAEAEAQSTALRSAAEAKAVEEVAEALAENPLFVEYVRVKNWDGALPNTMIADSNGLMFSLPATQ